MRKNTARNVATVVLEPWAIPYGVPDIIVTDNGMQLRSKFFATLCASPGIKLVTTTEYRLQTNKQVDKHNRTLEPRLRHYIDKHQQDRDLFVQLFTYAYSMQVHRATGTTPFCLKLSHEPPGSHTLSGARPTNKEYSNLSPQLVTTMVLDRLHHLMHTA